MNRLLPYSDFVLVPFAIALCLAPAPMLWLIVVACGLIAGFATWTLAEYAVHRLLHDHRVPSLRAFHMRHHQHPEAATGGTAISTAIVLALVGLAIAHRGAAPFVVGVLVAYWRFILLHHGIHHGWAVGGTLAGHHERHHHAKPRGCYGVSTTVWDRLFGTL